MDECVKCQATIYGLGDDYYCPVCHKVFCYDCIKKHGCSVRTETVGNKSNYVFEI